MRSFVLVAILLFGAGLAAPASAGEIWRAGRHSNEAPYEASERVQAVRDSEACWSACGSYTTWNQVACLVRDPQGRCLKLADAGDRSCQRACRTRGGPFLPIDTLLPFEY